MKHSVFMKAYKKRWAYRLIKLILLSLANIVLLSVGVYTYYNNTNNPIIVKSESEYYGAVGRDSYIQIVPNEIYDLGIVQEISRSRFGIEVNETEMYYMAINLDGKLLTIALSSKEYEKLIEKQTGPYIIKGRLTKYTDEDFSYIRNALIEEGLSPQNVDSVLYSNYLKQITPFDSAASYLFLSLFFMLIILKVFVPVIRNNSSALRRLKNYSNGDLEKALYIIDNEIELSNVYKNKPFIITTNYIIVETQQIVFALPLKELMWVYKSVTKGKLGIKNYSIVLVFSDKGIYKIDLNKNNQRIDDILNYISEHSAGTIVGFQTKFSELYKKNPNEFIHQWKMNKRGNESF